MPPSKHSRDAPPQISISSWIMGGPIVTKPRRSRPKPVLVTTEPATAPKTAEAAKPNVEKAEDGKEEAKKSEEAPKKVEEVKPDAVSKASDKEKSDSDWTWAPEQDALILELKGEKVSWKEIATRMSLAKSDIQVRFKELQKKSAETLAADTAENSKGKGAEKDKTMDNSKGNDAEKDKTKDGQKEGKNTDGGGGGMGNEGETGGRLKADDNWSREDCEILEMLEARYREQKWLSMQASFYNLTGRMIRADIIERKFSEASS